MIVASPSILASLPMYDWPELRQHTDDLWHGLSRHMGWQGELNRNYYSELWKRQDLNFSQTCGYPFTHEFKGLLNYVATPHYNADGCIGPTYCSMIFAREAKPLAEFYGSTLAMNSPDSMSGMLAAKLVFAPHAVSGEFFRRTKTTGSHRNSLAAVRTKFADICAIDSVGVGLAKKHCPEILDGLVEIARSPTVPALPFVTRAVDVGMLQFALQKTFADENLKPAREALLLSGFSILPAKAYDQILDLEAALPPFAL